LPATTEIVRTTGALAWWQHRQRFLQVASDRGLPHNPIVRGLPPHEALELVALSLCQAIYHDLEKSTGVNVWTFAQSLASGWFERGGEWSAVRSLVDVLGTSARVVVEDIRAADPALGGLLDIAVSRALIVIELAIGGLLAERLRQVDAELIALQSAVHDAGDTTDESLDGADPSIDRASDRPSIDRASVRPSERPSERFIDRPTIPFLRPDRAVTHSGESPVVVDAITAAVTLVRGQISPRAELLADVVLAIEAVVADSAGNFAAAVMAARELYGARPGDERADDPGASRSGAGKGKGLDSARVMPLYDALDKARILIAASVHQLRVAEPIRARALRALCTAHQRLVGAVTGLVVEAVNPFTERMREAQAATAELRDAVAKAERRRADLERRFATIVDPSLPWGARGTEW
jgi:hypothetical protein